jgi:hypothetical protein
VPNERRVFGRLFAKKGLLMLEEEENFGASWKISRRQLKIENYL